jgi:transcriptional regulator with XRE-family HTH domain
MTASIRYSGVVSIAVITEMHFPWGNRIVFVMTTKWRDRLSAAIEASGKSRRAISIEAKCGAGYLFDVLEVGKEPTIDRLMRIADVLGITLSWLLYGFELGPEEQELIRLYARLPETQRRAMLDLAGLADQQRDE